MAKKPVKIGVGGRQCPPMDAAVEYIKRVEREGWDFIQYPDQISTTHPTGMLGRPVKESDPSAVNGVYAEEWCASFEIMAAASVLTERIEIHLGATDLLRRSPAVVANSALTLQHLSKGRTVIHIAQGENKQFIPFGESRNKPLGRMKEALKVIDALWSSEGKPVSRPSEFWPLQDAVFPFELYNGKKPPLLMVGGGPTMEGLAGQHNGWSTYVPGGVHNDVEELAGVINRVKENAEKNGKDPDELMFFGMVMGTIGATDDEAWRLARTPAGAWWSIIGLSIDSSESWKKLGFEHPLGDFLWPQNVGTQNAALDAAIEMCKKVPDEVIDAANVWGSPDRVAAKCKDYVDAGITHLSFWNLGAMGDPSTSSDYSPLVGKVAEKLRGTGFTV